MGTLGSHQVQLLLKEGATLSSGQVYCNFVQSDFKHFQA